MALPGSGSASRQLPGGLHLRQGQYQRSGAPPCQFPAQNRGRVFGVGGADDEPRLGIRVLPEAIAGCLVWLRSWRTRYLRLLPPAEPRQGQREQRAWIRTARDFFTARGLLQGLFLA